MRNYKKNLVFVSFFCLVGAFVGTVLVSPFTYRISALKGALSEQFFQFALSSMLGFCLLGLPIALLTGSLYLFVVRVGDRVSARLLSRRYLLAWFVGVVPWAVPILPYVLRSNDAEILLGIPFFFGVCSFLTIGIYSLAERRWSSLSFASVSEG